MGENVIFPVTSSIQPWQDVELRYTAVSSGGSFLAPINGQVNATRTGEVTFYSQGPNLPKIGILTVPTIVDSTAGAGSLTVSLVNDDTNPAEYVISDMVSEQNGTANILDISGPILEINSVSTSINEGEMAKFIVTASSRPNSAINVKFTPTDLSGSYLDATMNPTGVEKTEPLTFIQRFGSNEWTAELNLRTRSLDRTIQPGGVISVLLNPADDISNYEVATTPNNLATVSVVDLDTPIISINNAPDTIIGNAAKFTLVADIQPIQALEIKYIVTETEGNFLDETNVSSGQERTGRFKFVRVAGQGISATLSVNTESDPNSTTGKLTVTIFSDFINSPKYYKLSTNLANRSAEVNLIPTPIPTLSFSNIQTTAEEGTDSVATIIASEDPKRDLMVKYTLFDTANITFLDQIIPDQSTTIVLNLDGSLTKTETVSFSQKSGSTAWTADLPIPIRAKDGQNTAHGEIKVELNTPATNVEYEIATTSARSTSITVHDKDIPIIRIEQVNSAIAGFDMIVELESNIATTKPITIRYLPTSIVGSNWLDETAGSVGEVRTTTPLTFVQNSSGDYIAEFSILTKLGPNRDQGLVNVQLQEDTNNPQQYIPAVVTDRNGNEVFSFGSHSVNKNPNPQFSVKAGITTEDLNGRINFVERSEFNEGDIIKLQVATDTNIRAIPSVMMTYTVENLSGNFLSLSSGNTTETRSLDLTISNLLIGGGTYGNYVDIPLRLRDGLDSNSGRIKISLNAGSNYQVSSNNEVTLQIRDHAMDTPKISISNAPEISATETAQFTLMSDILPWQPVVIRYNPVNSAGNFLGVPAFNSGNEPVQSVTFTQPTTNHLITGTLTVPTIQDANNSTGRISVTILDDNDTLKDYTLTTDLTKHTAIVQIKSPTKPTLSIRPSEEVANEGGTAKFVVTASKDPTQDLDVKWTRVEQGSFLDTTVSTQANRTNIGKWTFRQRSGLWTYELSLRLKAVNQLDEPHGTITVTLDQPESDALYLIADSPQNSATKTILDQTIPEISIANASETLAGNLASFTLTTATEPHSSLNIKFTAENLAAGGNFLDPADGESGSTRISESLTFTSTANPNEYTSTLEIPTIDDLAATSGTINIVLVDDDDPKDYTIAETDTDKSAQVMVIDVPILELSLNNATATTTNEGELALIVVSVDEDPKQPLSIKYTPTNIKGSYLNTTNGNSGRTRTTDPLTFTLDNTSGKYTARFPVATNSDTMDSDHGEILIVLDESEENANYTVAMTPNNQTKIIVYDDETPLITIGNIQEIVAGNKIELKLTSNLKPWQDLAIKYTPENETGKNFLDTTGGLGDSGIVRTTSPLSFKQSGSNFSANLEVPTVTDPNATTGKITVTLQPDVVTLQNPRIRYRLSNTNSEKASVINIKKSTATPIITIADVNVAINEGETARFIITASVNPERPLNIKFTPTNNSGGNFLDITGGNSGATRTKRVKFTDEQPSVWTATIEIPTNSINGIDEADGSITVTLDNPTNSDGYTIDTSNNNNQGTVSVKDADTPVVTIKNATETLAGNTASFELTTSIRPLGDELTIYYSPSNLIGSFLDTTAQMQTVPFSSSGSNQPYIGNLTISTRDDPNSTSGSISLLLQDDTTNTPKKYILSPISVLRTATAPVVDVPNPTISITAKNDSIVEGNPLRYIITATENPKRSLTVKYTPTEDTPVAKRHFDPSHPTNPHTTQVSKTQELTFRKIHSSASWTSEFQIPVRNADGKDADTANIRIELDNPESGAGYTIASAPYNSTETKILDSDTPIITIANATQTLAGNMAMFTLTSDIEPWQNLDIKFIPSETSGNFLDTTNNNANDEWIASNINFSRSDMTQPWTYTLMIPTVDDLNNTSGEITITLVDDDGPENYQKSYTINSNAVPSTSPTEYYHTATVDVIDVPIPTLSIDEISTPVSEGNNITFVVRSNIDPVRNLKIWYIPENTSQSFLNTTGGNSGDTRSTNPLKFERNQGDSDWSASITVATSSDGLDSAHGSIKISLALPDDSDLEFAGGYSISTTLGEDHTTVSIQDIDIPIISILPATETLAGKQASFALTSNIAVWQPIYIKFIPTEAGSNFLSNEGVESNGGITGVERTTTEKVRFITSGEGQDAAIVAETPLKILTIDDLTKTEGNITITLVNDGEHYTLDTTEDTSTSPSTFRHKTTVKIVDVPHPTFSITDISTPINEGEIASFVVTATENPKQPITLNYSITNSEGDYFTTDDESTTDVVETTATGSVTTTFEKPGGASQWTTTIPIQSRLSDSKDADHGKFKVTLNSSTPAGLIATAPDNDGEIIVHDDSTPTISISNAPLTLAGRNATFTLESDLQPWEPLTIRYKPVNETDKEFLNFGSYSSTDVWESDVTFTPKTGTTTPTFGTFTIPTRDDPNEVTGDIIVTLQADNNDSNTPARYVIAPSASPATVEVIDVPIPTFSISAKSSEINEGGDVDNEAKFIVSTPINPRQEFTINYTTEQVSGNYIESTFLTPSDPANPTNLSKSIDLTFQPNNTGDLWTAVIPIPLRAKDGLDAANGTIMIALDAHVTGPTYLVNSANDDDTITILDLDVPLISITAAPQTVATLDAKFTLTADIRPWQAIKINYKPNNVTHNFLDLTAGPANMTRETTTAIEFTPSDANPNIFKAILPVLTRNDPVETTGTISVELLDDQNPKDYRVEGNSQANTVETEVVDPPNVTLSIDYLGSAIEEGQTATFVVSTTQDPRRPTIGRKVHTNQ